MSDGSLQICLTSGEPAGIGPDLIVQLAQIKLPFNYLVIADPELLQQRARLLNLNIDIVLYESYTQQGKINNKQIIVYPVKLKTSCVAGQLSSENSEYVIETLTIANKLCLFHHFSAIVTAPIHKAIINDAGINFTGHTEFFSEKNKTEVVMMLMHESLRVALVTTHLPLSKVSQAITANKLTTTIKILTHSLQQEFNIARPHIVVCGLNPHAGEDGYLGNEEIDIIEPVLKSFENYNFTLSGPIPADTAFTPNRLKNVDAVLAMYHDQGLPVLKYSGFGNAINITLGLPYIRTSVDHGTALELAGTGKTNIDSLKIACMTAFDLSQNALSKRSN